MKDPLDLTPMQARDIVRRHEEVALAILSTIGSTPEQSLENMNNFVRDMSEKLMSDTDIANTIEYEDRRRLAGLLNLVVCPMLIAQWKYLMRSRNTNQEKTNE